LILARVVQGLATGAAASAVGAGLIDLDRVKGTVANAVGPLVGTASGSLMSALMIEHLPAPTQLVYLVLGVVFIAQTVGLAFMRESVTPRPGALASLRPQFRLPWIVRGPMFVAAPAVVASWALVAFYGSLGPAVIRALAGTTSVTLGGVGYFVLAIGGALAALLTPNRSPRSVLSLGTGTLIAGVATMLAAISI